jgi:hypothetical protein
MFEKESKCIKKQGNLEKVNALRQEEKALIKKEKNPQTR